MRSLKLLSSWWNEKGRILAFRLLIVILSMAVAARLYPPFQQYIPEEKFLLLFIGPLLLLLLDILIENSGAASNRSFDLVLSGNIVEEFRKKIREAKSLDIAGSSSESFFLSFRDEMVKTSLACRVILRKPLRDDKKQHEKVSRYAQAWESIKAENPDFKVEVRFTNETTLRLLIFDQEDAYFGFYKWDGKKYWGHNVPLIHATPGSQLGNYLLDIANNRFRSLWEHCSERIGYRS